MGLGPTLYLPWGASGEYLLRIARADGSAVDLTGATGLAFIIRSSPTLPDADADVMLTSGDGLTVIDLLAGLVKATLSATRTADLVPFGPYWYNVQATLATGEVIRPDRLRGKFYNELDSALSQELDGGSVVRLDSPTGSITPLVPAMSNYTLNRYDLTGLTGGASTDLDGLSADTLSSLVNGAVLELFFSGSISARFRLRAKGVGEVETLGAAGGWLIICDNDATRCWELIGVAKQGVPCVWNPDTAKFHQVLAAGNPPTLTLADTANAFVLPD